MTSPTFTLMHEYDGTRDGKPVKLFHLDVYRLEGERQLETLGLDELLTPDALVLVEWGDKFKSIRKRATGEIVITSDRRRCAEDYGDAEGRAELAALRAVGGVAALRAVAEFVRYSGRMELRASVFPRSSYISIWIVP